MPAKVVTRNALARVRKIHGLSREYNQRTKREHSRQLLHLMRKHVPEIEELYRKGDPHFLVETGDLLILCLELLLEHGQSPDDVITYCFGRYERKLSGLLGSPSP